MVCTNCCLIYGQGLFAPEVKTNPKHWTRCCEIRALVGETFIHFLPENLGPYQYFDLNHCLSMSSTDCSRVLFSRLSSLDSLANAFPKRWRLSLKPWGSTVQAYWLAPRVSGSLHSKAERHWESECWGIQRDSSLSSKTEILGVPSLGEEGVWVWRQGVKRDDCLTHCCWVLHQLILPGRHPDRNRGAAGGLAGSEEACCRNLPSSSWSPLRASGFKGYCLFQGCFPQALNLIFYWGSTFCPSWHWGIPNYRIYLLSNFLKDVVGDILMPTRWVLWGCSHMHSLFGFFTSLDFTLRMY